MSNPNYLSILILSLDSPLLPARTSAADFLLALVTLEYPRGHRLVMGAFEHFRATHDDLHTFQRLVSALDSLVQTRGVFGTVVGAKAEVKETLIYFGDKNKEQMQRDIKEFLVCTDATLDLHRIIPESSNCNPQITAVALLRLIVDIPDELEYRIHLRNQLMASGFGRVLKVRMQESKDWLGLCSLLILWISNSDMHGPIATPFLGGCRICRNPVARRYFRM